MQVKSYITERMDLPQRICLPVDTEVNSDLIKTLIEIKNKQNDRFLTLQGYYKGNAKIRERKKESHKSNNKMVLDYASYIVDILQGMAVGRPVTYAVQDEDRENFKIVQDILDSNREQDENTALAKMSGINGLAYEIVYVDEEKNCRFNEIQPQNMILVYDDKINPEPWLGLYVRDDISLDNLLADDKKQAVTAYTADKIIEFESTQDGYKVKDGGEFENVLNIFPVIEWANNDEYIGDFERVISLIDALNLVYSDNVNNFEEQVNALLILWGMVNTDSEDVKNLKEDGILLATGQAGGKQDAKFITKDINDDSVQNLIKNLDVAIHKFSKAPNVSDEKFSGIASGESQKYKVFATDQVIELKQRKYHTALTKRMKLICKYLDLRHGKELDYRNVTINFQDNKPYDELNNAQTVKQLLDAGVSRQYAMSKLKGIDDIGEELARQRQEKEEAYQDYANSFMNDEKEDEDLEDEE